MGRWSRRSTRSWTPRRTGPATAGRYERSDDRQDKRAGSYTRRLQTKAGEVELKVPRLRTLPLETAIIERYRRRESSVEKALVEMYLAGG